MTNVEEILQRFGLHPPKAAVGRYYTTCPKCSATRSNANKTSKCLGITIDDQGVQFGCNHCDFKGGALYKPNGADHHNQFVAIYPYNKNGELLYQVCRTADKQFRQRRPDGNGGWIWNTQGVEKILFHLDAVTEAIAKDYLIAIVEGEKDVLNLERIGIVATCNPGGANEPGKKPKWTKEYSEALRGADIIVIPDHDAAGYAHADVICRMSAGIAKSVRMLKLADHWPDCPKGGDISDWLAAGHTRERLDELIEREAKPRVSPSHNGSGKHSAKEESKSTEQQTAPPPNTDELLSICAAKVKMKAIEWLWPYRFAFGKLGIVAGLPDEGKGQILAYIIAMITTSGLWPCEEGIAPKGKVVLLTAEDDIEDTVVPRLVAAGAELTQIEIIRMVVPSGSKKERMFSLITDLDMLARKIAAVGNVRLVLIDPVSAYMGVKQIDSFRTNDVRSVLGPVVELAARLRIAFIGIMHFNKRTDVTSALLRISDSLAYGATARHVYAVIDDAENKRKLFVKAKNNLAKHDQQSLAYHFGVKTVGFDEELKKEISAPYIEWEMKPVAITANEAMQAASNSKMPQEQSSAVKFLKDFLADGPKLQAEVIDAAEANLISGKTLRRAKDDLKIISEKERGVPNGQWRWALPEQSRHHEHWWSNQ